MNDYLVVLGLSIGYSSGAEPRDGAPMVQVRADSVDEAVHLARGVFGTWTDPVFVVPAYVPAAPPDRRGLMGATVIRGVTP